MEQRKLTIDQTVRMIDGAFSDTFYYPMPYGEDYYTYRIYPDGSMIAKNCKDNTLYELTWSIDANNAVTFPDKTEWKKVEETYIQSGEIGARNKPPFQKMESRGQQQRFYQTRAAQTTSSGNGIEGMGIVTGQRTLLYRTADGVEIYEEIAPEAVNDYDFAGDIISAFNHNFEKILGRTSAGTLTISKEANGVKYIINELPNTSYGNDLKESVSRGDIMGSSFVFTIADGGETWEDLGNKMMLRTITKFDKVYELGPVVNPAYMAATVSKRSANVTPIEIKQPKRNPLWQQELDLLEMQNI